jgi:Sugar (and other) transporter
MSNSDHEQQVLESIEGDLASTGPKLASMLAIFARLTAGEEMPVREKLWRAFDASSAKGPRASAQAAARTAWPRRSMAPMYISEQSPRHLRGGMTAFNQVMITFGIRGRPATAGRARRPRRHPGGGQGGAT